MSVKCAECGSQLEWTVWGTRPVTRIPQPDLLAAALHEARFYCWTNRDDVCTADHDEAARQLLAALRAAIEEADRG